MSSFGVIFDAGNVRENVGHGLRIVIHGPSGSGKSTLAEELSQKLEIPCYHLDDIHWQPGWKELPIDDFRARVRKIVQNQSWIIDGNYSKVRPIVHSRVNVVIILALPTYIVLWQLLLRTLGRNTRLKFGRISREPLLIKREHKDVSLLEEFWILGKSVLKFGNTKYDQLKNEVLSLKPTPKLLVVTSKRQFSDLPTLMQATQD